MKRSGVSGQKEFVVSPVRVLHPEFGYVGTSSFCRILVAFLVCGLIAGASGVIRFKEAPEPDPKDAMALATGEALSSTPSIPAAIAEPYSDNAEFAQKPPDTGAIAPTLSSRRPRSIQAINERPPIDAIPIGHADRPAVLSSEPAIPDTATPETPASSSNPRDDAPPADPSIALATDAPAPVASAVKRPAHSNHVRRRGRGDYSRSANYADHYYELRPNYQSYYRRGYARVW
jgi:hypothetical protein